MVGEAGLPECCVQTLESIPCEWAANSARELTAATSVADVTSELS